MKKKVTLYVNDPMGGRCASNLDAARRLGNELEIEVEVVAKSSREYGLEKDPPPCPSVAVDGRLVVKDGTIGYEELKAEILED